MGSGVEDHAGGIRGLRNLLTGEHSGAVVYDLLKAGWRESDIGTAALSWSEFRDFVAWLPPTGESAFHRSKYPKSWWWTPEFDFLALQTYAALGANWQRAGGESDPPELITCPQEDWQRAAVVEDPDAVPADQIQDELARRRAAISA